MDNKTLLTAALQGLLSQREAIDKQREAIDGQIAEVRAQLGADAPLENAPAFKPAKTLVKRQMSEEARRRIAAAQKKRWQQYRKDKK